MQQALPSELQPRYDQYQQSRTQEDVNLIEVVRNILLEHGLRKHVETTYDHDRFIIEGTNKPSDVQRYLLNRFWSYQLMKSEHSSIEERTYLIPNGTISEWVNLFNSKILPFVIANDLPSV